MIRRQQLTTTKGNLTNACIISDSSKEMLFSYETLVGLRTRGACYVQRDGLAGSRTTGKHIKLWLNGRKPQTVTEAELTRLANEACGCTA